PAIAGAVDGLARRAGGARGVPPQVAGASAFSPSDAVDGRNGPPVPAPGASPHRGTSPEHRPPAGPATRPTTAFQSSARAANKGIHRRPVRRTTPTAFPRRFPNSGSGGLKRHRGGSDADSSSEVGSVSRCAGAVPGSAAERAGARWSGPRLPPAAVSEPEDRSGGGPEQARVAEGALVADVAAVPQAAGGDGHRVVLPGAVEALRGTDLRGPATGA